MQKQEIALGALESPENAALLGQLKAANPTLWRNPNLSDEAVCDTQDIDRASACLGRFREFIKATYPETGANDGLIESPLIPISKMGGTFNASNGGRLYLKGDHALPISGSIKARGGIYEVLKHAEDLVLNGGYLGDVNEFDPLCTKPHPLLDGGLLFKSRAVKSLLSQYRIVVGSTGNLGLSIGMISAQLGFRVEVHMSMDAKLWKMDLLRERGAMVVAHSGNYSTAVAAARHLANTDPNTYFIDDEQSAHLFAGYAVAGRRLKAQLDALNISVSKEEPLYVYLPCGVGGGPGGVTYGLKSLFGPHVHCFFVEPTHAPAVLLGMASGLGAEIDGSDIGLDGITAADGLAVSRPSGLVVKRMQPLLEGIATVDDSKLYHYLKTLVDTEGISLEPSAVAGFWGYESALKLLDPMPTATHIVWATGGSMVPIEIQNENYLKGAITK